MNDAVRHPPSGSNRDDCSIGMASGSDRCQHVPSLSTQLEVLLLQVTTVGMYKTLYAYYMLIWKWRLPKYLNHNENTLHFPGSLLCYTGTGTGMGVAFHSFKSTKKVLP